MSAMVVIASFDVSVVLLNAVLFAIISIALFCLFSPKYAGCLLVFMDCQLKQRFLVIVVGFLLTHVSIFF